MPTWTAPDRPEPSPAPDAERRALDERLDFLRVTLLRKCAGLSPAQLAARAVAPSEMSLLGLVRHLSGVEAWFHAYDGQPDHDFFWNYEAGVSTGFEDVDPARADDDLAAYRASVERARAAVAGRELDETPPDGDPHNLRWVYAHMIEEYGRHCGHADLLRESLDGATGE